MSKIKEEMLCRWQSVCELYESIILGDFFAHINAKLKHTYIYAYNTFVHAYIHTHTHT